MNPLQGDQAPRWGYACRLTTRNVHEDMGAQTANAGWCHANSIRLNGEIASPSHGTDLPG